MAGTRERSAARAAWSGIPTGKGPVGTQGPAGGRWKDFAGARPLPEALLAHGPIDDGRRGVAVPGVPGAGEDLEVHVWVAPQLPMGPARWLGSAQFPSRSPGRMMRSRPEGETCPSRLR